HVEEAGDIRLDIGVRIDQRMPHSRLRGEMHHLRKPPGGEQRGHFHPIGDVEPLEAEAREGGDLLQPLLLEPHVLARIDIVTSAVPRTTTQCSERCRCFCSESVPPGATTRRFTWKRAPTSIAS